MTSPAPVPSSLYHISAELNQTLFDISEAGGEVTESQEAVLKIIQNLLTEKTDGICQWVSSQEDLIELADKKIGELKEFKDKINGRLTKFDGYVDNCLKLLGQPSIEGTLYSIKKRKPSKVVVIEDEKAIPLDYIKTPEPTPVVMVAEIAKALKDNKSVPGAHLADSKKITINYKLK